MKIKTFLTKNEIDLHRQSLQLCKKGEQIMRHSKDPLHDISHVENLIKELDYLINRVKNLKNKINYNVLLPAIFWHDTWNTDKKIANIFQLIAYQFLEGIGSANLYKNYALKLNIDKKIIKKTYYCIRKHSSFQIIPPVTLESKILIDLDKLEMWNIYRFINNKNTYTGKKLFDKKYFVQLYLAYSSRMGLYFKILEKRFKKYIELYWSRLK